MFKVRVAENSPWAIHRTLKSGTILDYLSKQLSGIWHRVWPIDGREISALRLMAHQEEKFAPTNGNGILISDEALRKIA